MQIQSDVNNKMSESQYQSSAFYDLFQAQQNLVDSITKVINKLFSPLTWILQETLYRRITKQQKGWIDINFLHKNPQIKWLFNKNKIPKGSHRKRNILRKAIDKSVLKRKRNLIKRKNCLLINRNIKNVIYFQIKSLTSKSSIIGDQQKENPHKQIMRQENFKEFIKNCLNEIKHKMEIQAILSQDNQIQIDGLNQPKVTFTQQKIKVLIQNMEIKGQINQQQSIAKPQEVIDEVKNTFKKPLKSILEADKKYFSWCFVYFPQLNEEQINLLIKKIQENLQKISNLPPVEKMQLQDQMQKLNLEVKEQLNSIQIQDNINSSRITLTTLADMIDLYYPKYVQIREQVGYHPADNKHLRTIQKQKQKQRQKRQLFECRFMDKRIDLVNDYHKKLHIQKQKQNYFMQKQLKKEQKRRLKQEKRRNKINLSFNQSKEKSNQSIEKSCQQKLRKMVKQNQNQQDKMNHQNEVLDYLIRQENQIQIQQENITMRSKKQQNLSLKELKGIYGYQPPKFHIRIPNINPNQLKLKQQQIVQTQILQQKQKNYQKQLLNHNYQDQQLLESPISQENNDQQFKLPKKRNRSKKSSIPQPSKQKKTQKNNKKSLTPKKNIKINNSNNLMKDKKELLKNQNKRIELLQKNDKGNKNQLFLNGSFITKEQKRQTQVQRLNQQNNTAYNLRNKKYSEGSYRKMVEFSAQSSQKLFNEDQQNFQKEQQKTKGAYDYHTRSSRSKNSKYF